MGVILRRADGLSVDISGVWCTPRPVKKWAAEFGMSQRSVYRLMGDLDSRRRNGGVSLRLGDCPARVIAEDLGPANFRQDLPIPAKWRGGGERTIDPPAGGVG